MSSAFVVHWQTTKGYGLPYMNHMMTMMDAIVLLAVAFGLVFLGAWLVSPRLRIWIERPKHRFLADVQSYDQAQRQGGRNEST